MYMYHPLHAIINAWILLIIHKWDRIKESNKIHKIIFYRNSASKLFFYNMQASFHARLEFWKKKKTRNIVMTEYDGIKFAPLSKQIKSCRLSD